MPKTPWELHGRSFRTSRRRECRCPSVFIARTRYHYRAGTALTAQVSFCGIAASLPLLIRPPYVEGRFICADCEYKGLAFNETHTKKHTLVRVVQKVEESKVSTEERLKAVEGHLESVEGELLKVRQLLSKLFEKGAEGSPSDPLTKGDILDAAMVEPSLGGPLLAKGGGDGEGLEGSGDRGENGG